MDTFVQAAFVVIVAWLLKLLAAAVGIPLDETTLNTLAAALVAYILSRLGPPAVRGLTAGFRDTSKKDSTAS